MVKFILNRIHIHAAAVVFRRVAGDSAAVHVEHGIVFSNKHAAAVAGIVSADFAAVHGERGATGNAHAAAVAVGSVAGDFAVYHIALSVLR